MQDFLMRRSMVGLMLIGSIHTAVLACCAGGSANPIITLQNSELTAAGLTISIVVIDSSWMEGYTYKSSATVQDQLFGPALPETVLVQSGTSNMSRGGTSLDPGRQYLIYSRLVDGTTLYGFVCSLLSGPLNGPYPVKVDPDEVRKYIDAISKSKSVELNLEYRDNQQLVDGKLLKGEPIGVWKFFDDQGRLERIIDYTPDQVLLRHESIFGSNGLINKESYRTIIEQQWIYKDSTVSKRYFDNTLRSTESRTVVTSSPNIQYKVIITLEARNNELARRTTTLETFLNGKKHRYPIEQFQYFENGDTAVYKRSRPNEEFAICIVRQKDESYSRRIIAHPWKGAKFMMGFCEEGHHQRVVTLEAGIPHGRNGVFSEGGELQSGGNMINGVPHGNWIQLYEYYPSVVSINYVAYKKGLKHGVSRSFVGRDSTGRLLADARYSEGELVGISKTFHYNTDSIAEQVEQIADGVYNIKTFYRNGQIRSDEYKTNNKLHGEQKEWYDDGQLMSLFTYTKGVLDGPSITYREGGVLETRQIFSLPTTEFPSGHIEDLEK